MIALRPAANPTIPLPPGVSSAPLSVAHGGAALRDAVFQVKNVTKTYRMGEVEVPALREMNLDRT